MQLRLTNYYLVMTIKHLLEHKTLWLGIAILWTIFIAILCLVKFDDLKHFDVVDQTDKYVHYIFHLLFVIFWSMYWNAKNQFTNKAISIILLTSFCYGIGIEIVQEVFTKTRKADIMDIISNTTGALSALLILRLFVKRKSITK
jgi:glycopeptide antibiotics resistance protein